MRCFALIIAALATSSCIRPAEPTGAGLARELAGYVAGNPQACVSTFPNENLRISDSRTIAYGYGRSIYVNRLAGECPALSPYNTVIVDAQSGQYCRGDRVRGLEPGAGIPGPWCNLGDWTPYRKP